MALGSTNEFNIHYYAAVYINCTAVYKISAAQRLRIQTVRLRESGMTQRAMAELMGAPVSTVNYAHMA
jgi:hypothetical protein